MSFEIFTISIDYCDELIDNLYMRLIDPEQLIKLNNLNLISRVVVEGLFSGFHRSPYKGFSVEFSQHRPYFPQDEMKTIDWKVYGRTDKFVVKEFEDRTNLQCYILLDISTSMNYSSGKLKKIEYAKILTACLTYLLISQRDLVGLILFSDRVIDFLKPKSTNLHQNQIFSRLNNIHTHGSTSIGNILYQVGERITKRSMIVLISDLIKPPDDFIVPLKGLRYKGNEVVVFWIKDPEERNFSLTGKLALTDPESGLKISISAEQSRKYLNQKISDLEEYISEQAKKHNITMHIADTSATVNKLLYDFVDLRRKIT